VGFADLYLFVLMLLALYVVGISLMTTQVSYPLYAAVPGAAFVQYHQRYNRRIPPVIIAPGFVMFLSCMVFPLVRPEPVPIGVGLLVALGGLIALGATVTAAIPSHLRLQRDGFDRRPYRTLRTADLIRTLGCLLSAALLVWSVLQVYQPR
jgi:hypothetical protein